MGEQELSSLAGENVNCTNTLENCLAPSTEVKTHASYNLAIPIPGYIPREMSAYVQQKSDTMFRADLSNCTLKILWTLLYVSYIPFPRYSFTYPC